MSLDDIVKKKRVVFELIGSKFLGFMSFLAARRSGDNSSITVNDDSQSEIESLFRSIFDKRLTETLCVVLMVLFFIFILDYFYFVIPNQVYGLVLDLFGAVIVAMGLFRGAEEIDASASGTTTTGYSSSFLWMTAEFEGTASSKALEVGSTVDGIIGTTLLGCGFLVQIWAITF